ncbi:calcium-binding protein, partial [Sphingomonas sp.]|uniref:calcium-binding protein n=1 Tax=Sphingomonas sp. TaxID=28214 RepID=UPI0025FA90A0
VLGGAGNDRLISGPAADTFDGGDGIDAVDYQKAAAGVTVTLGTNGAAGSGGGGDTLLNVENVYGSAFADTLAGNEGANVLKGGAGNDHLYGGDGNDILEGDAGTDRVYGGAGNDTYIVTDATDYIYEKAGEGTDTVKASVSVTLSANVENLILSGGAAIDGTGNALANVITGNGAANTLLGGGGNDTLRGGGGIDHLDGQEGSDLYIVPSAGEHAGAEFADTGTSGVDEVLFAAKTESTLTLFGGDTGIEQVVAGAAGSTLALNVDASQVGNALTITGNAGTNVVTGTAFDDTIHGGFGADVLYGNAGNDLLDGGRDVDHMYGGAGDDTYVVDDAADIYVEDAGEGTDTVMSSVSLLLRANVENLVLTGDANLNGTGNALDNAITGGLGINTLSGGDGNDTLDGGGANDTLRGGNGDDVLIGGAGRDNLYGGAGSDTFVFHDGDFAGVTPSSADWILDFSQTEGDRIDLHLVDAQTTVDGMQAFDFIGSAAFDGQAGELRYEEVGSTTYLTGDTNGDGTADFMIRINGLHELTSSDLVL